MEFIFNDGGRAEAGYKGKAAGDCVCRAISIATEMPYQDVYKLINEFGKQERIGKYKKDRSSARTGVYKHTIDKIMNYLGWKWIPTSGIANKPVVHLNPIELPQGRLVVDISKHCTAVINGVINDTHDCSDDETCRVYGYYIKDE